jgi:hypothetical protein
MSSNSTTSPKTGHKKKKKESYRGPRRNSLVPPQSLGIEQVISPKGPKTPASGQTLVGSLQTIVEAPQITSGNPVMDTTARAALLVMLSCAIAFGLTASSFCASNTHASQDKPSRASACRR